MHYIHFNFHRQQVQVYDTERKRALKYASERAAGSSLSVVELCDPVYYVSPLVTLTRTGYSNVAKVESRASYPLFRILESRWIYDTRCFGLQIRNNGKVEQRNIDAIFKGCKIESITDWKKNKTHHETK